MLPQCDVLLIHPALGGAGEAHLAYNSVRIEAVLANPNADLPEVVRLAWLIAQVVWLVRRIRRRSAGQAARSTTWTVPTVEDAARTP